MHCLGMSFSVPGLAGTTWTWDSRGECTGTVLGCLLVSQVLQGLLGPGTLEVSIQDCLGMSFSVTGLAETTLTWDTRGEYTGTVLGCPLVSQVSSCRDYLD